MEGGASLCTALLSGWHGHSALSVRTGEQRVSLAGNGREHPVTETATEESTFLFFEAEGDQDFLHV